MNDLQGTCILGDVGWYCGQSSTKTSYVSPNAGRRSFTATLVRTDVRLPAVRHTENYECAHPVHHCHRTESTFIQTLDQCHVLRISKDFLITCSNTSWLSIAFQ